MSSVAFLNALVDVYLDDLAATSLGFSVIPAAAWFVLSEALDGNLMHLIHGEGRRVFMQASHFKSKSFHYTFYEELLLSAHEKAESIDPSLYASIICTITPYVPPTVKKIEIPISAT